MVKEKKLTLKEWLFYSGLTCMDIAKYLDIHPTYLSAIVGGRKRVSKKVAKKIEVVTKRAILADEITGKYLEQPPKKFTLEKGNNG